MAPGWAFAVLSPLPSRSSAVRCTRMEHHIDLSYPDNDQEALPLNPQPLLARSLSPGSGRSCHCWSGEGGCVCSTITSDTVCFCVITYRSVLNADDTLRVFLPARRLGCLGRQRSSICAPKVTKRWRVPRLRWWGASTRDKWRRPHHRRSGVRSATARCGGTEFWQEMHC